MIDLRSDTVTMPTDEMRKAMYEAELGDDCYGEDPTINRLQDLACEMLGCEAALFVPTGSMANQIAVRVLSRPGGEVICEEDCHLIHHEAGACAMLAQVQLRGLPTGTGVMRADDVAAAVRPPDPYQPPSVLVAVENTHNAKGGIPWTLDEFSAVARAARDADLPFFCDGARIFNACVATGTPVSAYAALCDIVTLSLYKGLAAPMGSLVCGKQEVMDDVWRFRRVFGGALRQGGVVAAAGIVALETMVDRLSEDHANARRLAEGISELFTVDLDRVRTNMVVIEDVDPTEIIERSKAAGVLAGPMSATSVRLVTHKDVTDADIDRAIAAFSQLKR
jgi:threonine aldolase